MYISYTSYMHPHVSPYLYLLLPVSPFVTRKARPGTRACRGMPMGLDAAAPLPTTRHPGEAARDVAKRMAMDQQLTHSG